MNNILKKEEYTRSLLNSRWLRNMLEYKKEYLEEVVKNGLNAMRPEQGRR